MREGDKKDRDEMRGEKEVRERVKTEEKREKEDGTKGTRGKGGGEGRKQS